MMIGEGGASVVAGGVIGFGTGAISGAAQALSDSVFEGGYNGGGQIFFGMATGSLSNLIPGPLDDMILWPILGSIPEVGSSLECSIETIVCE
jgi:hypothetical protein